jgi:hypothetical protein
MKHKISLKILLFVPRGCDFRAINKDGISGGLLKNRSANGRNQSAPMTRFAVILFSLVLVYGEVAWALGKCLSHDDQHEHLLEDRDHHSRGSTILNDSRDSSWPVIHCAPMSDEVGPAALLAPTEIRRSEKSVSLHAASPREALSAVLRNDLWLEALFKGIVTFSLPIDIARRLFLSVLRI